MYRSPIGWPTPLITTFRGVRPVHNTALFSWAKFMNTLTVYQTEISLDEDGRYSLNDLHRAAMRHGNAKESHKPGNFLRSESVAAFVQELSDAQNRAAVMVIRGGVGQGTFADELVAIRYAAWIDPKFELAVYQTFRSSISKKAERANLQEQMSAAIILLESAKKTLNLSNSSMLGGYQKLQAMAGLPELMPAYAIDAPAGAADGSSRSTKSLRTLLIDAGIKITPQIAYIRLEAAGLVERKCRPSTTKGEKKFWCITSRGLEFGKNMTSPANPRETQCHWYETKAAELIKIIGGVAK